MTRFDKWFRAQFGKPPGGRMDSQRLLEASRAAEVQATIARHRLVMQTNYENMRDAAYKAWLARNMGKKELEANRG